MVPVSKIFGKPDTTKLLIGLGGVLAGVYLLKQTGLFGDTPSEAKKKKAEEGKVVNEIEDLKKKKINPTYSDSQYTIAANSIYNFLRYSGVQDDADGAENVLNRYLYNDADFLKLVAAYGKRNLTPFGIPVGAPIGLGETLADQFSNARLTRVNALLKQRGLTYQF